MILGLLLSFPVPGMAGDECPQQGAEPVILCGSNVIMASQPTQLRVRVAEASEVSGPAYLPGTEPPQESPYMGVLIKEDGPQGRYVHVGSFNTAHSGFFNDHRTESFPRSEDGFPLVPAGDYTLYFITKPGVQSVFELKLYGPSGRRPGVQEIRPATPAQLDWKTPVNFVEPGPDSDMIYSSGTEYEYGPGQQAFAFFSSAMRGPALASMDNWCAYRDRPTGDYPYWPGCPAMNRPDWFNVIFGPWVFPDGTRVDYEQRWFIPASSNPTANHGVNAIGVWRATAGTNYHHSALAWFLTLEN